MSADFKTPLEEWLAVLGQLWTAAGKRIDSKRLKVYQKALEDVPLGLLELSVKRVIRENDYHVVPVPGVIWAAVRKELGYPFDVKAAIEEWAEKRWYLIGREEG